MRLLIDILHPAHVHVFRNLAQELTARGHEVRFTLREKECARDLLDQYGIGYDVLSQQRHGAGLAVELAARSAKLWKIVAQFRPHFLAGVMGPSIALVGRLRRLMGDPVRTAIFYDTEMAAITNWFAYPLADYVCTPECYQAPVRGHHIRYPGYHELAYLHPDRFTPDPAVIRQAGIDPSQRYFVVRFVSYAASHDLGTAGISAERKIALIRLLAKRGRVVISSEAPLPAELEPYRLAIPAAAIHHILAGATLLVGESATMASECAVLGVPAVYISPVGRGYTDEEETRYGLVTNFTAARFKSDWLARVEKLADDPLLASRAREARARLLAEKVDTTRWMIDFFEREYAAHFGGRAPSAWPEGSVSAPPSSPQPS
jgi:predicted glycosyltransferase